MKEEQRSTNESYEPREPNSPETERPLREQPRIYVASLSDYNSGNLHGRWIDAAQDADDLHTAISDMLAASPEPFAEEWAIHDYEGFGSLHLDEYESIEQVAAIAQGIADHGPAFAAWAEHVGIGETEELERFEECFLGHWDSVEAYAEEVVEDFGIEDAIEKAAGSLAPYVHIDTEALARDLVLGGDVSVSDAPDGGVFLFAQ